jgi:phosphoribosyl 1,2-cyclic phosphodiesterase
MSPSGIEEPPVNVRFWGVRGSIPTSLTTADIRERLNAAFYLMPHPPRDRRELAAAIDRLPFYIRGTYGGCTACIEFNVDGVPIICDVGTGARPLGMSLLKRMPADRTLHVLVTHFHWDHIQGWPFFLPCYDHTCTIHVYSLHKGLKEMFEGQQHPRYSPVALDDMPAKIHFHTLKEGEPYRIGGARVESIMMGHPAGTCGFRIRANDRTAVFMTDVELLTSTAEEKETYREFADHSDLVVVDAQYGKEDVVQKVTWGHSYIGDFVELFRDLDMKRLCLFHYEPAYGDEVLGRLIDEAFDKAKSLDPPPNFRIIAAYEGLRLNLNDSNDTGNWQLATGK